MGLFGPPDVKKMHDRKDILGLIKALGYQKDCQIREAAAKALGEIGDARAVEPLIIALKDGSNNLNLRKASAKSLQYMYRLGHLDEKSQQRILSVEGAITRMTQDVEKKKSEVLGRAMNWWLGKPDPADALYVCDSCSGEIKQKEGTSLLGSHMRCPSCTQRLFKRWEAEGVD